MGLLADAVRRMVWPHFARRRAQLIADLMAVAAVPAPTFAEEARARHVEQRLRAAGLAQVHRDAAGNVIGVHLGASASTAGAAADDDFRSARAAPRGRPSPAEAAPDAGPAPGPRILLAAHLDTVFPAGTDVTPRPSGGRIHGPGIRDDAAGLAALVALAEAFTVCGVRGPADLVLAATVGEEGLGNLRGMRALLAGEHGRPDAVICVDGDLGGLVHVGIGSTRLRVSITGPGGHSWGNFGQPSAIHLLAGCIVDLTSLRLPVEPRTTLNVGTVAGGVSVNTIAPSAEMALDLRSVDSARLAALERDVRAAVARRVGASPTCRAEIEVLGSRPAASLPEDHPLVALACRVHRELGIATRLEAGSTDANLPLAQGMAAVCIGVSSGGGVHTAAEFLDADSLLVGVKSLALLIATAWEDLRPAHDPTPAPD